MTYQQIDSSPGAGPPVALVLAELDRILASELFVRSKRLSSFLKFIVDRTVAGQGDSLKEQVIALELYGKDALFDTAADPIVRVDARRLRDRLREYYAGAPNGGVVISVPKGSYVPVFHGSGRADIAPGPISPLIPARPDSVSIATARTGAIAPASTGMSVSGTWRVAVALVVLGFLGWGVTRLWNDAGAQPSRLITVTSMPGAEEDPSLSPDGNFVTFSWTGPAPDATADIWIKAVDGDALRNVTNTPDASEKYPAWSPDGQYIAFTRFTKDRRAVIKVSALGGNEQIVAEGAGSATWAPDGRSLVMVARTDEGTFGLVHHVLETGAQRRLTEAPAGFQEFNPRVSPDGRTVAFERYGEGRSAVHLVPLSGGAPELLGEWTGGNIAGLEWTPDGRDLLVSQPSPSGRRLVRVPVHVRGPAVPVPGIPYESLNPSVSRVPNGNTYRLAIVSGQQDVGLRLVDLQASRHGDTITADSPFCDASRMDAPGRFSPDGRQVAFTSDRNGSPQVWVASRDGSALRSVTQLKDASVSLGSWSPDGRWLVFDATIGDRTNIFTVSVDGGAAKQLTKGGPTEIDPEWSRDGRWIFYASIVSGRSTIWKVPAAGGAPLQLTSEIGFDPRESPDGESIYFIDRPRSFGLGPISRLKRVPAGGGSAETVDIPVMPGAWEVSETGIVFLSIAGRTGTMDPIRAPTVVQVYDFKDHRVRTLGKLGFVVGPYGATRFLTVSRDGRWALASHVDHWDRDILVVDHFR